MHADVFTQLSVVIAIAAAVSVAMRFLKQPLLVGYILTGIIVGPSFFNAIQDHEAFTTFSEIGITLLLFIIGLELSASVVKRLGKPVIITALALLSSVGAIGYLFGLALDFSRTEAAILGLGMFFSSTIIIAKVLSDKKELTRLNGQIAIGVILVDDIIATFALLFIAAKSNGVLSPTDLIFLVVKGSVFVAVLAFFGWKILPVITRYIAKSQELLFLFALAWGFGVASVVNAIGFSIEVGALFAGVSLAHLPYAHQIGARLKPLRDFFVILFFITLGERLVLGSLADALLPALVLSLVVLVLKPLIVMVSLGSLGYTRRTSFKTGINLSQISEFSIILVVLAASHGLIDSQVGAIITLVAIITITISTYLMNYDNWIFAKFEDQLHLFERKKITERRQNAKEYTYVLFGYKHGGKYIVNELNKSKESYVVADYNPLVIEELQKNNIPHVYGDVTDPELLGEISIEKSKVIINTIGDHAINMSLVRQVMRRNKSAVIICYSNTTDEANELYKLGASCVILPLSMTSNDISRLISEHKTDKKAYAKFARDFS